MNPLPSSWHPIEVETLQKELGNFDAWVLCGGHSVDQLVGRNTRPHGDTDIGVFRSQLLACLSNIKQDRVFLCAPSKMHIPWSGGEIDLSIHDIWIADSKKQHWIFQIMVFDDDGEIVMYRRDPRITWTKKSHFILRNGIRILNPLVTFLYKSNKSKLEQKEVADIAVLIEMAAKL